jgi:hypothetical protein
MSMKEEVPRFTIIPYEKLEELHKDIRELKHAISNIQSDRGVGLGQWMPKKEAKELLAKGTTWFWNKRQSRELSGKKAGNQWYYRKNDILNFIENGKSNI